MKKLLSVFLSALLSLSLFTVPALASENFTDVPDTHWAAETIDRMAEGGLIHGYEDGTFRPQADITIAEMATIISNAKGNGEKAENGYWAYGAIDYCLNTLNCLPSQGDITAENYGVACPRQLAIYMLMKGLGINATEANLIEQTIRASDIPDYALIAAEYKESVLTAYQKGVLTGKDDNHTFGPYDTLTRAEMATIFYRAGWIKAGMKVTEGEGPTNAEIIEAIQRIPGVTWTTSTQGYSDRVFYTTNELKYGGIEIGFRTDKEGCWIDLYERKSSLVYNASGQQIDVNGNVIENWRPNQHKGEAWPSASAYSYAARQLVKEVLSIAYPTMGDEAYAALMGVFNNQLYETSNSTPSALRWYDGRMLRISHANTAYLTTISIGGPGETTMYETYKAEPLSTVHSTLGLYSGSSSIYGWMYEFSKW